MSASADLFDRAVRHHQAGELRQAEALYRHAIHVDPTHAGAFTNLGVALQSTGQGQEALACFREAVRLNPAHADAYNNLAGALMSQGQRAEAIECYRRALRINPHHADASSNLGAALQEAGQSDEAIACYRQALRINPQHADAYNNLGIALKDQGQVAGALECYQQALRLNPNHGDARNNLGAALQDQGNFAEAAACHLQALRVNPNDARAYFNLGNALKPQGKLAEATHCYRQALHLDPRQATYLNNLGFALFEQRQLAEAAECYRQALTLDPGHKSTLWNRSHLRLLQGDFEGGWRDYEQRWGQPDMPERVFREPRWDGAALHGKTILLYAEQGYGDMLQFIRYAPLVKQRGGTVLLLCRPNLVRIFQSCSGIDQIVTADSPMPSFDVQAPLLSLPLILKTTLATVPNAIPYLRADPILTEHWRQALRIYPEFKIGVVWQGNPRFSRPACRAADQNRSIPLAHFAPLAQLPGVRLFSLQKGFGTEQLRERHGGAGIIDVGASLHDFMDTAAVMMNLDLIVSVDTAPAHLAGALGRPVWTVLPFAGCWRWLLDRADSPWYPTMRLFRQKQPGDWAEVFARIAVAARSLSSNLPGDADTYSNLGSALKEQGRLNDAIECYHQALQRNPHHANAHNNLGNALMQQGRIAEATACYREALRHDPNHSLAHNNLGLALAEQGHLDEASACYRQALRLNPDYANAHDNLGTALVGLGLLAEGTECFRQALRLNPNHANAHNNLGNSLAKRKKLAEASASLEQALAIDPGHKIARWNRSLLRLLQGDFVGGWPDYEQRWFQPGVVEQSFQQPRWDGTPLQGKTILVFAEQGLGDTVQFARYLPMVKRRGGKVILGCQPSLFNLLKGVAGADFVAAAGTPLPAFDVQIPLLSLPGIFGTTLDTIPADVPYLAADPSLVSEWRARLLRPTATVDVTHGNRLSSNIGIAWQGSMNQQGDPRSLSLSHFATLATVPGVRLFSLQVGQGALQLPTATFPVTDLGSRFDPTALDDLAAAMMNMDLVVTIDTAVAHLAGALGVPVWTALCFAPDWRWLLDRSDNPWYPTMRLFRQTNQGEWGAVFERIAEELRKGARGEGRGARGE